MTELRCGKTLKTDFAKRKQFANKTQKDLIGNLKALQKKFKLFKPSKSCGFPKLWIEKTFVSNNSYQAKRVVAAGNNV